MVDRINAVEGDLLCCFPSVRQQCAGAAVLQGLQLSTGRTFASQVTRPSCTHREAFQMHLLKTTT